MADHKLTDFPTLFPAAAVGPEQGYVPRREHDGKSRRRPRATEEDMANEELGDSLEKPDHELDRLA